jgi:hypothetical protein
MATWDVTSFTNQSLLSKQKKCDSLKPSQPFKPGCDITHKPSSNVTVDITSQALLWLSQTLESKSPAHLRCYPLGNQSLSCPQKPGLHSQLDYDIINKSRWIITMTYRYPWTPCTHGNLGLTTGIIHNTDIIWYYKNYKWIVLGTNVRSSMTIKHKCSCKFSTMSKCNEMFTESEGTWRAI